MPIQEKKHPAHYYTTLMRGIVCNVCGEMLPEMTMAAHLDTPSDEQHQCKTTVEFLPT